jgi:hypothetical protein
MNKDLFAQYPKKCLLKVKQTLACVSDSPKKPSTRDKTKTLGFQRVGLESGQPRVTCLGHLVCHLEWGNVGFNMCN